MPDEPIVSEFDRHSSDNDWFDEGEELFEGLWEQITEDFGDSPYYQIDDHARDLMFDGWFNADVDRMERAGIWFDFFDYTGLGWDDFDWDAWRDWYEA